tara:strand:- start:2142 stop:3302 length:1161 start_codon:yes stop_codon:yes gene_type:complete
VENLTPLAKYEYDLKTGVLKPDAAQKEAVLLFDKLHHHLGRPDTWWTEWVKKVKRSALVLYLKQWVQKSRFEIKKHRTFTKGLYLWGDVGQGKTYLLDVFFESITTPKKLRAHFYEFMNDVHDLLLLYKGKRDPLHLIADHYAKRYRIICFDEFFVSDIADAMLLGTLLSALFERGVIFVATSNVEPNLLYKNGLQRDRFLPVIDLLHQYCDIYHLQATRDYRLRVLEKAEVYHAPLDEQAHQQLESYFHKLSKELMVTQDPVMLHGRAVEVVKRTEDLLWVDFMTFCGEGRSYKDYTEIAFHYHTVFISNVLKMGDNAAGDDVAKRFLAVVDAFYDRNVKLIMTACAPIEELYEEGKLTFEFKRCFSRLHEMQSRHYLSLEHSTD